jgi:hypothetical protein
MELLCFRGWVFKEEMPPANIKNMVTLYRNSFEDPGKQIKYKKTDVYEEYGEENDLVEDWKELDPRVED